MGKDKIIIKGAREHNLKNIDLELPRNNLIVITGISGSGKSSLAFDTIYAEGQRRYVESLSAYARQFLEQMDKPDVEFIEGLSPAISIEQRAVSKNPRSTVGTVTEIYDYLRLLYARIGKPHCPKCGKRIAQQSAEQIIDKVMLLPADTRFMILAPLIRGRKGEYKKLFDEVRRQGFVRVRVDGELRDVNETIDLDKYKKHDIEVVVDRLVSKPDSRLRGNDVIPAEAGFRNRIADSVETALKLGNGIVYIQTVGARSPRPSLGQGTPAPTSGNADKSEILVYSEHFACIDCGFSFPELEPRMFSFNSPHGACPTCYGLGTSTKLDPQLIVPDPNKSIREGALAPYRIFRNPLGFRESTETGLEDVAREYDINLNAPFRTLTDRQKQIILYGKVYPDLSGDGDKPLPVASRGRRPGKRSWDNEFEGVIPHLERRFQQTESEYIRQVIFRFMAEQPCPTCHGNRLKPESLAVKIGEQSIIDTSALSVKSARTFFDNLALTEKEKQIASRVLKEIKNRLGFLVDVGLDYLTLNRSAATLAGGEAQRIRLATQIGSQLVGVLYILDEPSIGLHQRDNRRLLNTLCSLRDIGNTIIVIEHDEETIRSADWVVDLGPGAGKHGGYVVAAGTPEKIMRNRSSVTGKYLVKRLQISVPASRRQGSDKYLEVVGARANNLKSIQVKFPLGLFVCITGVSGSGKSSLVNDILYRALAVHFYGAKEKPGPYDRILGLDYIDKVINVDQSPIGRTPRSNPATYVGVWADIRNLFSQIPEARVRGYQPGRFSFNVKGGRCENCSGGGLIQIEMHFLPDVYVQCEFCKGKRFNRETLEIRYKWKNIAEVLEMTVEDALEFFTNIPTIKRQLQTLFDVGLGYIQLGQSATTLSGGEAQRVKLATELTKRSTGRTVYILDEPTTGLHFADVQKLLDVLNRLVNAGNTVLVIEHNLDVVKTADYIIDLGPEGGDDGGQVIATGTPEQIADHQNSYTGKFLNQILLNNDYTDYKREITPIKTFESV
ncbi:MAG: excinuclease ABC subunit UvrA [bacterium]|nr:excinuclease ABC subunit UvrA [bacterium]